MLAIIVYHQTLYNWNPRIKILKFIKTMIKAICKLRIKKIVLSNLLTQIFNP